MPSPQTDGMRPKEMRPSGVSTSPQAIFRTEDAGDTWHLVPGLHDNAQYRGWMGAEQDGTPDGPKLHSINVDPRDARHLYIGMSGGGIFESTDGGADWRLVREI